LFIIGKSTHYIKVFFEVRQEKNQVNQPFSTSDNAVEHGRVKGGYLLINRGGNLNPLSFPRNLS